MSGRLFWTGILSAGALLAAGCECCGVRRASALPPPMFEPTPPPANLPYNPLTPTQVAPIPTIPPTAVTPQSPIPPAPVPVVPPPAAEIRGYTPATNPPQTEVLTPSEPPPTPRLSPPVISSEPPPAPVPSGTQTQKPAANDDLSAPFPVGIPQFSVATEGVTSGLKPSVYGGLDWLRANGYKAVLHIKAPGADDSADRQVIETYHLKYRALDVSPKTLCRATLAQFDRIIADPANRPLFVYDQDGVLAGGLWYLHFRLTERDSAETARLKAARLGLKTEVTPENRAMWLAVQQLVKDGTP
jgi:hypothetical protein